MLLAALLFLSFAVYANDNSKPLAAIHDFKDVIQLFDMPHHGVPEQVNHCIKQTEQMVDSILSIEPSKRTFENTAEPMYQLLSDRADMRILQLVYNTFALQGKDKQAQIDLKDYQARVENHYGLYDALMQYHDHVAPNTELSIEQKNMIDALTHYFPQHHIMQQLSTEPYLQKKSEISALQRQFEDNVSKQELTKNISVLNQLYNCQQEIAKLRGFANYAEMQLKEDGTKKAESFLQEMFAMLSTMEPKQQNDTQKAKKSSCFLSINQAAAFVNKLTSLFGFESRVLSTPSNWWHQGNVAFELYDIEKQSVVAYVLTDMVHRPEKAGNNSFTVRVIPPVTHKNECKPGVFVAVANMPAEGVLDNNGIRAIMLKIGHVLASLARSHQEHYLVNSSLGKHNTPVMTCVMEHLLHDKDLPHFLTEINASVLADHDPGKSFACGILDAETGLELSKGSSIEKTIEKMSARYARWFTKEQITARTLSSIIFMKNTPATLYQGVQYQKLASDLCDGLKKKGTLYKTGLSDAYKEVFSKAKDIDEFETLLQQFLSEK